MRDEGGKEPSLTGTLSTHGLLVRCIGLNTPETKNARKCHLLVDSRRFDGSACCCLAKYTPAEDPG